MTSKSRAAQEQLALLEKQAAPFEDQLAEAAKFIGLEFNAICKPAGTEDEEEKGEGSNLYHGREEWLLRWLLKRLQAPGDDIPRRTTSSWRLFCRLLRSIPISNTARILAERHFISIIRSTLQEAQKVGNNTTTARSGSESSATVTEQDTAKISKKRKRSGEFVATHNSSDSNGLAGLLDAVFAALDCVVQYTKPKPATAERGQGSEFSTEYMKTVLRTTAEEAATVLGLWLSLCQSALPQAKDLVFLESWLSPFIDVWNLHAADENPYLQFSLHTTRPLLSLLGSLKSEKAPTAIFSWVAQLERLVATTIVIPAKADPELLETLTKASVLQNTENGPLLLEIAMRSVQPTGSTRRRKAHDEKFLQSAFVSLKESVSQISGDIGKQIGAMLRLAITHRLGLDLAVLRSITDVTKADWDILATLIELDANVFLVPDGEDTSLLDNLLDAITKASLSQVWPDIREKVVSTVLVPLIRAFAKARDLSGFIRHWFQQLLRCDQLRGDIEIDCFSAWEDDTLQAEFVLLLEPSLRFEQIKDILDWLSKEDYPGPACVILEAITAAISSWELVDELGLRMYDILRDNDKKLKRRYRWRSWRIISHTLDRVDKPDVDKLSALWEEHAKPFNSLPSLSTTKSLFDPRGKGGLESLEIFRFACSAWTASKKGTGDRMRALDKPILLDLLRSLSRDIRQFTNDLLNDQELGDEICGSKQNLLNRGKGWTTWALVRCLFVDHPDALVLFLESEEAMFEEMLENIFCIASAAYLDNPEPSNKWLQNNQGAFSDIWRFALRGRLSTLKTETPPDPDNPVFCNRGLLKTFIQTLLNHETTLKNPLINSPGNDTFAIRSLLDLTVEETPKEFRGVIMSSWLPPEGTTESGSPQALSYGSTVLDKMVLAEKRKIMRQPKLYEGMKFQDFINLADTLAEAEIPDRFHYLSSLKELVRLTLVSAQQNVDQPRSKTYLLDAFKKIQKKVGKASEKKKHRLTFALIAMFEVALDGIREKSTALHDLGAIDQDDLQRIIASFKHCITVQLKAVLRNFDKGNASDSLLVLSIVDALATLGVEESILATLEDDAAKVVATVGKTEYHFGERLEQFMVIYGPKVDGQISESQLKADIDELWDPYVKKSLIEKTQAAVSRRNNQQKLELLHDLFGDKLVGLERLDKLWAISEVIRSCEDTRPSKTDPDSDSDSDLDTFDLTEAYTILATYLRKCTTALQFRMISEILEQMLKDKPYSISQYNIDATLGSISIMCSPDSPTLYPIYMHLCSLAQAVITHHRLKLNGHSHLTQQTLQCLLRCLFSPLPHSTVKTARFSPRPPWLLQASHNLKAKHAAAFNRILLSICDPTVSAVQRHSSTLTSEKDKAKKTAAQYMKFILQDYVRGQLEMKMLPEVREALMPGIYSILATFSEETRNAMSAELDNSGRAVYMRLYQDWRKYEKPRG